MLSQNYSLISEKHLVVKKMNMYIMLGVAIRNANFKGTLDCFVNNETDK